VLVVLSGYLTYFTCISSWNETQSLEVFYSQFFFTKLVWVLSWWLVSKYAQEPHQPLHYHVQLQGSCWHRFHSTW